MTNRRLFALLALLLGLLAGVLLLFDVLHLPRTVTLEWFAGVALKFVLAIVIIIGSLIIYGGRYIEGGLIVLIVGLVVAIVLGEVVPGILAFLAGLFGIIAEEV